MSPKSVRKPSVTSRKTDPTAPPIAPSRWIALDGRSFAASAATPLTFSSASGF
jgi:hypothetical protein